MPRYLIEGSCDGGLFTESVDANSQEDAEAFAIERLCEAWGQEYGPDTTLDDLGDSAMVTPYSREDYIRDEAEAMWAAIELQLQAAAEGDADKSMTAFDQFRAIRARIQEGHV